MHRRQKHKARVVINWNDPYDPFHPIDLDQYKTYLHQVSHKHREREAYLERKRKADEENSSDSEDSSKPKFMFRLDTVKEIVHAPIPLSKQYTQMMSESTAEEIYARRLAMQQQSEPNSRPIPDSEPKTSHGNDSESDDSAVEQLLRDLDESPVDFVLELINVAQTAVEIDGEMMEDIKEECERYGRVNKVEVEALTPPIVRITCGDLTSLEAIQDALHGRLFAGRQVTARRWAS